MTVETVRMLLYVVAGIAVILFLVAIIMSHKSWKIHTLIMVFLVFSAACTTVWFSAQTLKVHNSWRQILHGPQLEQPPPGHPSEGLIAATEKLVIENRELEFGKDKADGQITKDGILQLRNQLAKTLYVRGRVWTNCEPSAMAPGAPSVTVQVAAPKPSRIKSNMILYVFESRPFTAGGNYLGIFRVTEAIGGGEEEGAADDELDEGEEEEAAAPKATSATVATLQPAWDMSDFERARLEKSANLSENWTMYEKMPVDGHDVFTGLAAKDLGVGQSKFDGMDRATRLAVLLFPQLTAEELAVTDVEFSKMGRAAQLEKFFDSLTAEDLDISDDEFAKMDRSAKFAMIIARKGATLSEFIKDHQDAADDDPDARIEELVEFQEDYPNDEAEIKFADGQSVWLPRIPPDDSVADAIPSIDELVESDIVERIDDEEPRYSRELRDYSYLFLDLYLNRADQQARIEELDGHIAELSRELEEKKGVGRILQSEQDRLTRDSNKLEQESAAVEKLLMALRDDAKRSQARMDLVRKQTIELAKRLDAAQMRAVEAINKRTPAPPQAGIDASSRKPTGTTAAVQP